MTPPILKRFLISFEEHKLLGFFAFAVILGASVVIALQPEEEIGPPTYKAVGTLALRNPPPIFTTTGQQLQEQGRISISKDLLLAPRVLRGVQNELNLNNEELSKLVRNNLKIVFPGEESTGEGQPVSNVIRVELNNNRKPDEAKITLRAFMQAMIRQSRWINTSQLRARIEELQGRLDLVKGELTIAEEAFYRYISTEGTALLAIQDGSLFNGITNSQLQQRQIRLTLDEIEGQINSLSSQLGLTPDQAYTSSVLSADPIIASLRAQILDTELQLERLEQDLQPEHPTIIELEKRKAANEALLQQRAEELIGGDGVLTPLPAQIRKESNLDVARQELANQLVALETQREGFSNQLESLQETEQELRQQYEEFPDKQLQQARLVQAVESQRILYQTILAALTDARSAEAETVSSLIIAQEPFIPQRPPSIVLPRNPLIIMAGGAAIGLVAGAGMIFLLATLDDRLHTAQELREALVERDLPLLGQLPNLDQVSVNGANIPVLVDTNSPYLAFYERVRSNLRRLEPDASKVVLITSTLQEEGKTITAYNLAIASAHAGKRTLLVEADLRSPSRADIFNLEPSLEAKTEPLRYYASRTDAISLVPDVQNLYILPSPGPQRQAVGIIESSELQRLLKDARGRFDMVIVDSPSLSRSNDALLLEPLTDGMIVVTRPGVSRKSMLAEAIDQLVEKEISLLGAVINDVEELTPRVDESQQEIVDADSTEAEEEDLALVQLSSQADSMSTPNN